MTASPSASPVPASPEIWDGGGILTPAELAAYRKDCAARGVPSTKPSIIRFDFTRDDIGRDYALADSRRFYEHGE